VADLADQGTREEIEASRRTLPQQIVSPIRAVLGPSGTGCGGSSVRGRRGSSRWFAAAVVALVVAVLPGVQALGSDAGAGRAPAPLERALSAAPAPEPTDAGRAAHPADVATADVEVDLPALEATQPAAEAVIAPPPADLAGPVASAAAPAQLSAPAEPGSGVWAVIIGIDDYPGTSWDLSHAVDDANAVDEALDQLGVGADRRLVLRDGQADRETVLAAASWLVERAGPDATAVFFYAGHVRHLGGDTQAFVTADGGLIPDHEMAVRLGGLSARNTWFLLATCYAGGFTELLGPGRILTGAADGSSLAYENHELGGSYLVHYLIREGLLEGRAEATVQDAFDYADRAIARDFPNRRPVQFDQAAGPVHLDQRPAVEAPSEPTTSQPTAPSSPPPQRSPAPAPEPEPDDEPASTPGMGGGLCLLCRDR
jgi:metacaspase-1